MRLLTIAGTLSLIAVLVMTGAPVAAHAQVEDERLAYAAGDSGAEPESTVRAVNESIVTGQGDSGDPLADPLLWIESLGGSTGEVMKVHLVNPTPDPITIDGYFALEPVDLSPAERDRIREAVRQASGNHVEVTAAFYCLQFDAAAPPEGIAFRIAGPEKQARFRRQAVALDAARRLNEAGRLSPDTNPESYYHSIRQWAVWTLERGFDRNGFLDAFLQHARKNVEASGQAWTDSFAGSARRSAEGRWQDITQVLETAARMAERSGAEP
jgi:hypothetical protein